MSQLEGLANVVYPVTDIDASVAAFTALLGS